MLSSLPAPTGAVTEDTLKPDGLVFFQPGPRPSMIATLALVLKWENAIAAPLVRRSGANVASQE